ncbi:hypothetical protein [Nonomuraea dietziae]|uniref:hypothetical protein n=1 Tax=Nonomuraea dietziae TaxID=65515 RepID=UPI0031DC5183
MSPTGSIGASLRPIFGIDRATGSDFGSATAAWEKTGRSGANSPPVMPVPACVSAVRACAGAGSPRSAPRDGQAAAEQQDRRRAHGQGVSGAHVAP